VDHDYDLIVIGGGAAGLAAAQAGAAAKARPLLVSEGEIGGECTFTGCVPSKTLIEAAARGAGFPEALAAVRKTIAAIAATETADVLTRNGVNVLRGHAEFTAPRQFTMDGRTLRARGFVLATGSRPAARLLPAADLAASKVIGQVLAADGITVRGVRRDRASSSTCLALALRLPGSALTGEARSPSTCIWLPRRRRLRGRRLYCLDAVHPRRLRDGPDSRQQCAAQALVTTGQLHHQRHPADGVHRPADGLGRTH